MSFSIIEPIIVSIVALLLSAYSISVAKKRGDTADVKELTSVLATLKTQMAALEKAVLGTPTVNEQLAVNTQRVNDHERRISKLEEKAGQGK